MDAMEAMHAHVSKRQTGQVLPLAVVLLIAVAATVFYMFNSGQLVQEKLRLTNTADAVAFSAGVFEGRDTANMPRAELADLITDLTGQMLNAARDLQFELAARIRDEIADLKKELRGMDAAGVR